MEPISPELALVDPELARAHIAWLELSPEVPTTRPPPTPVVESCRSPARVEPWWSVAAKTLAALSLAANGFLLSVVVARDPTPVAQAPVAALAVPAPPAAPLASSAGTTSTESRAAIEQQILSLVSQSPNRLPRTLVDAATGLPQNNLQAVCRAGPSNTQVCVVRPARHRPGEGLYVRYTLGADGRANFTWYPYRTG